MVHTIEVKQNRFAILQTKPNAWQLVIDKTLGVVKNDTVNVVEINSVGVRTGRNRVAKVYFVGSPIEFTFRDDHEIIFLTCALGVNFDSIGNSFIIS
jgi:hypothetical protein